MMTYGDGCMMTDEWRLMNADDEQVILSVKEDVKAFMQQFPLYPELG
jgi:hypothetical protein